MDNTHLILLVISLATITALLFNEKKIKENTLPERAKRIYINELCDILYYAEIAINETVDDPEEREIVQDYINDFHDLIIEDMLQIGKGNE